MSFVTWRASLGERHHYTRDTRGANMTKEDIILKAIEVLVTGVEHKSLSENEIPVLELVTVSLELR